MPGLRLIRDTPHVDFIARCAVGTAVTSHRQHTHTHLAWYPENILHDAVTVCWIAAMTTLHSSHDSIQSNAIEKCNFFLSGNFLFGCWSEKKSKSAHLYEGEMQSCIICILNVEYWTIQIWNRQISRWPRYSINWCSYNWCSLLLCPKWTEMEMAPLFRIIDIRCRQFRCSPYTVTSNQRSIAHWCWPHTSYSIWVEDTRIVARNSKRIGKL